MNFFISGMFLPCKFAFCIQINNGVVLSYFFCYRAISDRVCFSLFREKAMSSGNSTIGKFPSLVQWDKSLPPTANRVQRAKTTGFYIQLGSD